MRNGVILRDNHQFANLFDIAGFVTEFVGFVHSYLPNQELKRRNIMQIKRLS